MSRFLLAISAFIFLGVATELHQLAALPLLVRHFKEHHKSDQALSFLKFLELHYSGNHPDDDDESEDNKLPFKSTANINHTDIPIADFTEPELETLPFRDNLLLISYVQGIPCNQSFTIFHPPRCC